MQARERGSETEEENGKVGIGLGRRERGEATAAQNRIEYKGQAANASESCLEGGTRFLPLPFKLRCEVPRAVGK